MGKGLVNKLKDVEFIAKISEYDIVCLSECWITCNDDFDLPEYRKFVFPRSKGRGGGIVIFYRKIYEKNLTLKQNIHDCIVWLQLNYQNKDIYLAFCYFPPDNSVFYGRNNDIDLFDILEDGITLYKSSGRTYVFGDMNARTSNQLDVIVNDRLSNGLSDILGNFDYENDQVICQRNNMDRYVNSFGRKLLSLCKTTGLRILNGRHEGDKVGNFTFFWCKRNEPHRLFACRQ